MTYDKILKDIIDKKVHKENGGFNGIPFGVERYSEWFDSWNKGEYTGLLGATGDGKSRLLRHWLYGMVDFAMRTDYKLKVLYFALEDMEIPVGKKIISHYLYTRQKISLSAKALNSRDAPLPQKYIDAIQADELFWRKFYGIVEIVNHLTTPNEIKEKVSQTYAKYGKEYHIVVLCDNQSNLTKDPQDNTTWDAILRFSKDIVRLKFCPVGITTITVLQTNADAERQSFRGVGKGGLATIEPNISSISDATVVSKSMHTVFALFSPFRYDMKRYPYQDGYNVEVLRDKIKILLMLKSNEGEMAPRFPLLFSGKHEIFEPLPSLDNKDELERLYNHIIMEEKERREQYLLGQKKLWT